MNYRHPGGDLVVKFRKKCGEMRWKKTSTSIFYIFCGECDESNCGELFIFIAFSVFLQKDNFIHRFESLILYDFYFLLHCANCHFLISPHLLQSPHFLKNITEFTTILTKTHSIYRISYKNSNINLDPCSCLR